MRDEVDVVAQDISDQANIGSAANTPQIMPDFVSCRVANSILKYLDSLGYDAISITGRLPVSYEYLSNSLNWISADIRDTLATRAVELTNDEKIMYRVGLATPRLSPINGFEYLIRFLGNPERAYKKVPQYAHLFDKSTLFDIEISGEGQATVIFSLLEGGRMSKHACYYAQGVLAAIPTVWGLPPASVQETQCMLDEESNSESNPLQDFKQCIYKMTWVVPEKKTLKLKDRLLRRSPGATDTLKKLEENFHQLDEKNAELISRNTQLSIIREIALSIDSVRTSDQVLELVVEKTRDIPGIRFALVFELDGKTGMIDIPYFSKARGPIARELKAIGFDPETYLGRNPANRTFVFSIDRIDTAMDLVRQPRVIIKQHLYEFTGRALPRTLSDTIERVLGVKSVILVPIIIDGKLIASMMFLTTGKVPTDILEMAAAHCATALKNVQKTESLEMKNRELSAINIITSRISYLHGLDAQLKGALDEILKIFSANGASIHLISNDGKYLDMVAQKGMPEFVAVMTRHFPIEHSAADRFLNSRLAFVMGDMSQFTSNNEEYKTVVDDIHNIPYITTRIEWGGSIKGILILVRYRNEPFTGMDTSLFVTIANQIAICLENNQLQSAVSASEERLNMIFQSTAEGIIEIDLDGRIIRVNQAVVHMHGYDRPEEVTGLSIYDLISETDRKLALNAKGNTLNTGSSTIMEFSFRRKDGTLFCGEASASLIRDAAGNPSGFVTVTRDVTDRKKAEEALRESERKYSLIAESTIDYIAVLNLKGDYVYMSPAVKRLGYTPEELIGRNSFDFIHPEDRRVILPLVAKYTGMKMKELFGLKNEAFSVTMTYRFRTKQNNWAHMESVASGIESSDGKGIDILVVSRDLTEKMQAEAKLRIQKDLTDRCLNVIPNAIVVIDHEMQILLANKAFEKNHASSRDFKGKQITEKIVPANVLEMIKNVATGNSQEEKLEYRTETNEGDKTYFAIILSIGGGQTLLTLTDLTREREQEAKIYLTERLASVGEMASGIAHELNNPLTSVIGLSALLAEEELPGSVGEDIQAICQEARRASQIVKNLLSFARRHDPKRQLTQIGDIINDVLKLRTYEQEANNIAVITSFDTELPLVMVDNFQIQQAFLNIILNAEQAMHEAHGKGCLKITTALRGGAVRISFTDDGPGIKPADRKRIFDPFFTTKEVGKGTGLGLSITYGIIKSHSGRIWAESEPGQGSTFIVELPVYNNK